MILPVDDYIIIDFDGRDLKVVGEATTQEEADEMCRPLARCGVYREQGEELYRAIVEVTKVKSTYGEDYE